jgi:hypothetical protein
MGSQMHFTSYFLYWIKVIIGTGERKAERGREK